MARQVRLPQQLGRLGDGQGVYCELLRKGLVAQVFIAVHQRWQLLQEGLQVIDDPFQGNVRRLHAKQQTGLPVDLSDAAEHRVAQLQLDAQALVERPLEHVSE